MRVLVKIKRGKNGYSVYNTAMVKIGVIDRLNLINAYRTYKKGQVMLCGSYKDYSEDVEAYHKISNVSNIGFDIVVMTGYDVYCQPSGTILEVSK